MWDGIERRRPMHDCKFETTIIEMHGDLKTLVSEFKNMNGTLRNTKQDIEKHELESTPYRKKIDEVWAGIHFAKWIIGLILGTGLLFHALNVWAKK